MNGEPIPELRDRPETLARLAGAMESIVEILSVNSSRECMHPVPYPPAVAWFDQDRLVKLKEELAQLASAVLQGCR